jgi:hypothetical protein
MSRLKELLVYRIIWLVASIIGILSVFVTYVNGNTLVMVMQDYLPKTFNVIQNPATQNVMVTFSSIGFLLIILGSTLGIAYSIVTSENSRVWNAHILLQVWNTAVLGMVGIGMLCAPIFVYSQGHGQGQLIQILSSIGTQYSPVFEGFGTGFYLTCTSVAISLIAGRGVLKNAPELPEKNTRL